MVKFLIIYLIIINIFTFFTYGLDKFKAKHKKWRISEKFLLTLPFLGGCFGSIFAMNIFKHKTKKTKFNVVNYLTILLWTIGLIWLSMNLK